MREDAAAAAAASGSAAGRWARTGTTPSDPIQTRQVELSGLKTVLRHHDPPSPLQSTCRRGSLRESASRGEHGLEVRCRATSVDRATAAQRVSELRAAAECGARGRGRGPVVVEVGAP